MSSPGFVGGSSRHAESEIDPNNEEETDELGTMLTAFNVTPSSEKTTVIGWVFHLNFG